jgi:hypothetical protein
MKSNHIIHFLWHDALLAALRHSTLNFVALVHERTIPTEQLLLVSEVNAKFRR